MRNVFFMTFFLTLFFIASGPVQAGPELVGSPIDEAYRAQFTGCDRYDRFGTVQFPIRNARGRILWYGCRSDPSRLERLERLAPTATKPEAVVWQAKLAHDLDGSPKACNNPGTTDQCPTTLMLRPTATNRCPAAIVSRPYCLPIDASTIPYIVIPTAAPSGIDGKAFQTKSGLQIGDLGMVIANGRRVAVIIADTGPAYKIGEGSTALLAALSPDGKPRTLSSGVIFVAFPGTSVGRDANADMLAETVRNRGNELFQRLVSP